MAVLATIIDVGALARVVAASLVASLGIAAVFGVMMYGATRFVDLRREERRAIASGFAILAAVCLAAFVVALVYGLTVMASK
jgi:hypothetical protein